MALDIEMDNAIRTDGGPEVYVGPNLVGKLHLNTFTIYRGGQLPEPLASAAREDHELSRLFVPVAGLSASRRRLAEPGSSLARAARAVAQRYTKE
jgi:hypothetical protein